MSFNGFFYRLIGNDAKNEDTHIKQAESIRR